jgi:transaldolase/glucose-6-phosphate isomerase
MPPPVQIAGQSDALGESARAVEAALEDWRVNSKVQRLWSGDTSLWSGTDEDRWLGWLHEIDNQIGRVDHLQSLVEDIRADGFKCVLLLGMGGSSLCAEVMKHTFGAIDGYPELFVLDSTVPTQIRTFENRFELDKTLFIVSSKSGGTIEPNAFKQYFYDRARCILGADKAGSNFIAITDPGTALHELAQADRFRHVLHGVPDIGGRYSALSNFGTVPAAIMGVNLPEFLDRAHAMALSCGSSIAPEKNPGVRLGLTMGVLAQLGRDKLTLIASPGIAALGTWLEQLISESTGKENQGIVPIDGEVLGPPEVYGDDRLFVYLRLATDQSAAQDAALQMLEQAGQPVVRITLEDRIDLGQEFFRWEIATAVAGSVLGINPFNQPDVEASKVATRNLSALYEQSGELPPESPPLAERGLKLFTDSANAEQLGMNTELCTLEGCIRAHLDRLGPGDYFAINAYVEMNDENRQLLQAIRRRVRDAKQVATTLGFGPRFLHSTGQLHKGGPNNGVFLQITSDDAEDLPIPAQKYTFGTLKRFQAQGDFEVLAQRKRRVLRVHLGPDVGAGLESLQEIISSALDESP